MWTTERRPLECAAVLVAALSALTGDATAQARAPSVDELQSMYWTEVLRTEITLQRHMISASNEAAGMAQPDARGQWIDTSAELLRQLSKLEHALHRLQVYLLPRIHAVDPLALAATIRQAHGDVSEPAGSDAQLTRIRMCEDPTWLPG